MPETVSSSGDLRAPNAVGDSPRQGALPAVPISQPLALFVPPSRVTTDVPISIFLPELLPGTLSAGYDRDEQTGLILRQADRFLRHHVTIGGARVAVTVNGSQEYGLPTAADYDFLWALFHLVDKGRGAEDGTLTDVSFRELCDLARKPQNARSAAAAKRALRRFAGVKLTTRLRLPLRAMDGLLPAASHGDEAGAPPLGLVAGPGYRQRAAELPVLLEREVTYNVLDLGLTRLTPGRADATDPRERIEFVRIEPLWIADMRQGCAAWLNRDLHCRLDGLTAKRLLQVGTLAAARRDWRPGEPWELTLSRARELLGIAPNTKANKATATIAAACDELASHGAMQGEVIPGTNRRVETTFRWHLGDTFLASALHRAIAPEDPPEVRVLIWHLTATGVSAPEARDWIATDRGFVRDLLRCMYWLRAEHGGRPSPSPTARPTRSWAAWLKSAWKGRWAFEEPEFRSWVQRVLTESATAIAPLRRPPMASPLLALQPAPADPTATPLSESLPLTPPPAEGTSAPIAWPDDVWGRAAAMLEAEDPTRARSWLEGSVLVNESDDAITIRARDPLAAEWIDIKLRGGLEGILTALRGVPTTLRIERGGYAG